MLVDSTCIYTCNHPSYFFELVLYMMYFLIAEFQDYTYDNFTINFESGDAINATHCISVIIIDDDLLETNETFFAVLLPPDDDAIAASPTVTRVVIQDDRGKGIAIMHPWNNSRCHIHVISLHSYLLMCI